MRAYHRSSDLRFRKPVGAVGAHTPVHIALDVAADDVGVGGTGGVGVRFCTLCLYTASRGDERAQMRQLECKSSPLGPGALRFSVTIDSGEPGLAWYHFEIGAADGSVWTYGARSGQVTGEGSFSWGDPPAFQITVYTKQRMVQPDWWYRGIAYQIFPDRFAQDANFDEKHAAALLGGPRGGALRRIVDWDTPPAYTRRPDGSIAAWDFYGGSLKGITEHLGYLQDFGVSILYLNPIFEARSSHRYDIADYLHIDPLLGTEQDFCELCARAAELGIRIVLDGVFNHCGADSRYFNRFGTYPEKGAYESEASRWRDWFTFYDDGRYECWWGNDDLPDLKEDSGFAELLLGKDGIIRRWLRLGASGWRLDVADELSDSFIQRIKAAALAEKPDALILGEVWEDASNKTKEGVYRRYFMGSELDSVMNYPFRTALICFLRGEINAFELTSRLQELYENYPPENFYAAFNLLGSHDRERIFSLLGGAPYHDDLPEDKRGARRLTPEERGLAKGRFWLAVLFQLLMPGVPSVYYGDEWGLEGLRDPYNRGSFPWSEGGRDRDCMTMYRNALALRKSLPVCVDGSFEILAPSGDVCGFWRRDEDTALCLLVNRSREHAERVMFNVDTDGRCVQDVVSGHTPLCRDGRIELELGPLGSAALLCTPKQALQKELPAGIGILCHVTSVPAPDGGPGDLGSGAYRFVDILASGGWRYWQILPLTPVNGYGSPYAGYSAFAGNTALLARDKSTLTDSSGVSPAAADPLGTADPGFVSFCENNAAWLEPYAAFMALKERFCDAPWYTWPEVYRHYSPNILGADQALVAAAHRHKELQYTFETQWQALKRYANSRGILIIGDIPMFVSADSADVWAHPEYFAIDAKGQILKEAGAPPDAFNEEGQAWGTPCFRWDALERDGFCWWTSRLARACKLYDVTRLDHFIGFSSYLSIGEGQTPKEALYAYGPGRKLFEEAFKELGPLPLIAEDLGNLTPAVRVLLKTCGFSGIDVLQFQDTDPRRSFEPKAGAVVYSSTHDTPTLRGFCQERYGSADVARELIKQVLGSSADIKILTLQDALELGDEARMNYPGVPEGNWRWQAREEELSSLLSRKFC